MKTIRKKEKSHRIVIQTASIVVGQKREKNPKFIRKIHSKVFELKGAGNVLRSNQLGERFFFQFVLEFRR